MTTHDILVVSGTYYPKADGVRIFVDEFIRRANKKQNIALLAPKFGPKKHIENVKQSLLEINQKREFFNYNPVSFSRRNRKTIKKYVKESNIIFIQEFSPAGFLALLYARRFKKKIVCYIHNFPWEFLEKCYDLNKLTSGLIMSFFRFCYTSADILLIPYKEMRKELNQVHIKVQSQVAKLGVDINRFKPVKNHKSKIRKKLNLPEDKTIVTYVGRISPEKNIGLLHQAIKKLDDENIVLLLVGDGEEEYKEQFKHNQNIILTGFVDNVEQYLQASDIFVMPSKTETTSLATLEAMGCGIPVLATKVGYIKTYLRKGYNGEFIAKDSPSMLALKIDKLRNNKEYYDKLSQGARNMVAYQFSWDRSIAKIIQILKSLQ